MDHCNIFEVLGFIGDFTFQYLIEINILNNLKLDFTLNITLKIAIYNVYAK